MGSPLQTCLDINLNIRDLCKRDTIDIEIVIKLSNLILESYFTFSVIFYNGICVLQSILLNTFERCKVLALNCQFSNKIIACLRVDTNSSYFVTVYLIILFHVVCT